MWAIGLTIEYVKLPRSELEAKLKKTVLENLLQIDR